MPIRDVRLQAAILRGRNLLVLHCRLRDGQAFWLLPGGAREPGETPEAALAREVREELGVEVTVGALVDDAPAEPPDGTYARWRTYHCTLAGGPSAGEPAGQGADGVATLGAVAWLPLDDEAAWPAEIRGDRFLAPQLRRVAARLAGTVAPALAPLAAAVAPLRGLDGGGVPWAVAGGWALDLWLGRVTRPHADVDVAVFRADQAALRAALPGWAFEAVVGGARRPWAPGTWLAVPVHEVYATPPASRPPAGHPSAGDPRTAGPALELLLNERDGADWVFRRDRAVRRPLARALVPTAAGLARGGPGPGPPRAPVGGRARLTWPRRRSVDSEPTPAASSRGLLAGDPESQLLPARSIPTGVQQPAHVEGS